MSEKKILVVDDDDDLRRGLHVRLRAEGYETIFATDGMSATAIARKQKPDLIIIDLGLPAGDGFVVIDRLSAGVETSIIPIIVLTARDSGANRQRALGAGARAFLQKPVDNALLMRCIAQALQVEDGPAGSEAAITAGEALT